MAARFRLQSLLTFLALGTLTACAQQAVTQNNTPAYAPNISEQALKGATANVLTADFGPPMLLREDGPAQVWLYQTPICNLDVFLYKDAAGIPRVKALVLSDGANVQDCLLGLTQSTTTAALEHNAAS